MRRKAGEGLEGRRQFTLLAQDWAALLSGWCTGRFKNRILGIARSCRFVLLIM
jgi:hypothetical protein